MQRCPSTGLLLIRKLRPHPSTLTLAQQPSGQSTSLTVPLSLASREKRATSLLGSTSTQSTWGKQLVVLVFSPILLTMASSRSSSSFISARLLRVGCLQSTITSGGLCILMTQFLAQASTALSYTFSLSSSLTPRLQNEQQGSILSVTLPTSDIAQLPSCSLAMWMPPCITRYLLSQHWRSEAYHGTPPIFICIFIIVPAQNSSSFLLLSNDPSSTIWQGNLSSSVTILSRPSLRCSSPFLRRIRRTWGGPQVVTSSCRRAFQSGSESDLTGMQPGSLVSRIPYWWLTTFREQTARWASWLDVLSELVKATPQFFSQTALLVRPLQEKTPFTTGTSLLPPLTCMLGWGRGENSQIEADFLMSLAFDS